MSTPILWGMPVEEKRLVLEEYGRAIEAVTEQRHKIAALRSRLTSTVKPLSSMPGGGGNKVTMEDLVASLEGKEKKLKELEEYRDLIKETVTNIINQLEDADKRLLLTYRYLEFREWRWIVHHSKLAGRYSRMTLFRMVGRALLEL